MDRVVSELSYTARRLRQSPGFSIGVIFTLALGIGANSAIFSVVNTVLLQPLRYRDPGTLVTLNHYNARSKNRFSVSAIGFRDYRDRTHSFSGVAAVNGVNVNLTGLGEPEPLVGARVSGQYFSVLGVAPAMGRPLIVDDDQKGKEKVAVLSDGVWRRLFGARREVLQQKIVLDGESYDVVGVMPPGFEDPANGQTEVWMPIALDPAIFVPRNYTNEFLYVVARLKPGVSVEQASREIDHFVALIKQELPNQFSPDFGVVVGRLSDRSVETVKPALLVLLGAVGLVLLIACTNVANLMLARAAAREKEIAIRTALGARAWDLVRQLLTESLVLSLLGGALGLLLAWWSVRGIVALNPSNLPRVTELRVDGTVIFVTFAVAVMTGLLFGLVPALHSTRRSLHVMLKEGGRGRSGDRGGQLVRRVLVVSEVALALMLLVGGGLLIRSFAKLTGVDPGFNANNVVTFVVALPGAKYPPDTARRLFWAALLPRLAHVPGVVSAGATTNIPFGGNVSTGSFSVEGYTPPPKTDGPWGDLRIVSPEDFTSLAIPLLKGRFFDSHDGDHAVPAVVVDEEYVRRYFPAGSDPIGKRMWFSSSRPIDSAQYITIVGVVGHARHTGLDDDTHVQAYFPIAQSARSAPIGMGITVRTMGSPIASVNALRNAVHEIDRDIPVARVRILQDLVEASMGQRRLSALLVGIFAALALTLASIGLYGVMSYSVAQRTRELGVRVALGAPRRRVLQLVLGQGMRLALAGGAIGLAAALGLSRLISSQLFGVPPADPLTYASVSALLATVALAATLVPALRATRIDPMEALREE